MSEERQAYPLQWPMAKPRTAAHQRRNHPAFKTNFAKSRDEVLREIKRLGGSGAVISSSVPLKRDGMPYAVSWGQKIANEPGVAVYFKRKGSELCFACDCWSHVQDNMHAVSLTIGALRGIARWGTGDMMEAAFTGFKALPMKASGPDPREILQLEDGPVTEERLNQAVRRLAKVYHPDIPGTGSVESFRAIQEAHHILMQTVRATREA